MSQTKIYEMVTDRIVDLLNKDLVPWRMPWHSNMAVSWKTGKPYRGINPFLLPAGGEYATFKQVEEAGGKVKKGEKSHLIVFWKPLLKEDPKTGKQEKSFLLRYYRVFEINTQCEGMESKRNIEIFEHDPIEEAEKVVYGFVGKPEIVHAPGQAVYNKLLDRVSIPEINDYKVREEYYCTLFHELVHSTGHQKRLHREGITELAAFGDSVYSFEELIAEMGAAMLCGISRIDNITIDNSASYIKSWLGKLKENPKWIIQAAGKAQKAVDHILGTEFGEEGE